MTFKQFTAATATLTLLTGCSWESGAWTGAQVGMNLSKNPLHVKVFLDDHKAEQNTANF